MTVGGRRATRGLRGAAGSAALALLAACAGDSPPSVLTAGDGLLATYVEDGGGAAEGFTTLRALPLDASGRPPAEPDRAAAPTLALAAPGDAPAVGFLALAPGRYALEVVEPEGEPRYEPRTGRCGVAVVAIEPRKLTVPGTVAVTPAGRPALSPRRAPASEVVARAAEREFGRPIAFSGPSSEDLWLPVDRGPRPAKRPPRGSKAGGREGRGGPPAAEAASYCTSRHAYLPP